MHIRILTLVDNSASWLKLLAEWGLSIIVEVDDTSILVDTGCSKVATHNAQIMKTNLKKISKIMFSHGHEDHQEHRWNQEREDDPKAALQLARSVDPRRIKHLGIDAHDARHVEQKRESESAHNGHYGQAEYGRISAAHDDDRLDAEKLQKPGEHTVLRLEDPTPGLGDDDTGGEARHEEHELRDVLDPLRHVVDHQRDAQGNQGDRRRDDGAVEE